MEGEDVLFLLVNKANQSWWLVPSSVLPRGRTKAAIQTPGQYAREGHVSQAPVMLNYTKLAVDIV